LAILEGQDDLIINFIN